MASSKQSKTSVAAILASRKPRQSLALTIAEFDILLADHYGSVDDVFVSLDLADHILTNYNIGNRRVRQRHAEAFVETIATDRFINTGETVIFSNKGRLHSGQHRLIGVRDSKKGVVMDFRFGIDPAAFAITDTGAKRLAGDLLSTVGSHKPFAAAAAIKMLLAYEDGLPVSYTGKTRYNNSDIFTGFARFQEINLACELNARMFSKARSHGFLNAASNAFCYLALRQTNEETLTQFLTVLESGLTNSKNDPPRMLREKIIHDPEMARNGRLAMVKKMALYIRAWEAWRAGERPRILSYNEGEEFPVMTGVTLPAPVNMEDALVVLGHNDLTSKAEQDAAAEHAAA